MLVNGYYASKSRGWRCGWVGKVDRRPLFREISSSFGRVTRKRAFLSTIQTDLSCTPFFHNALWLLVPFRVDVFIPCVFGVAVDNISVCLKLEIGSGVFPDWRVMDFRQTLENMRSSWHS